MRGSAHVDVSRRLEVVKKECDVAVTLHSVTAFAAAAAAATTTTATIMRITCSAENFLVFLLVPIIITSPAPSTSAYVKFIRHTASAA